MVYLRIPYLVWTLLTCVHFATVIEFRLASAQTTVKTTTAKTTTAFTSTARPTTTLALTTLALTTKLLTVRANETNVTTTPYITTTPICLLKCENGGKCKVDPLTGEMGCECPGNWAGGLCETWPSTGDTFMKPCAINQDCTGLNEFCTNKPGAKRYVWPKFEPYVATTTQSPNFTCECPTTTGATTVMTTINGTTTVRVTTTVRTTTAQTTTTQTTTVPPTTTGMNTTWVPTTTTVRTTTLCICEDPTTAAPTTAPPTLAPGVTRAPTGVCYCLPGYYYSAELAGCVPNDPCAYGETCHQLEGGACEMLGSNLNCTCPSWMTDLYCNATVPIWGNWTDWSNCQQTCGTCRQVRTRPCIDHNGLETDSSWCNNHFGVVRAHIEMKLTNLSTACLAADNPCTRDPCNSNVFNRTALHTCIQSTTSSYGYICECAKGYSSRDDSPLCFEDSKCLGANDCQMLIPGAPAQRTCIDMGMGNYTCQCPPGMQRDPTDPLFRKCIDINECALGLHNCDSADRAICTNTVGSYYCTCKENLLGDGTYGSCYFDVFSTLMSDYSEFKYIEPNVTDNSQMNSPCISPRFPIPLLTDLYASQFYVTWNGLIVMTNYTQEEMCKQFNFGSPPSTKLSDVKMPRRIVGVVAPYWSSFASWQDADKQNDTLRRGIYYRVMHNKTSLITGVYANKPTATTFFQLLVIWHKMQYAGNPKQEATFYAWVSSDYINTWAGAGFADKMINWNIISPQAATNLPIRVGVVLSDNVPVVAEWAYSWASLNNATALAHLMAPGERLPFLNMEYGKAIQWTIGDESVKTDSPFRHCADWALEAFTQPRLSEMQTIAKFCPPSLSVTLGMYRFEKVFNNSWLECYRWLEGVSYNDGEDQLYAGCCYDSFTGTLQHPQTTITFEAPGHTQRASSGVKTLLTDFYALKTCCTPYKAALCDYFSSTAGTSTFYKAPAIATAFGGGHIVTFDGLSYTARNLGDVTLSDILDPRAGAAALRARLQGRLGLVSSYRTLNSTAATAWNWTAWTSFAVKIYNPDSATIEVRLNTTATWGYDILINQVLMPVPCIPTTTTSTTSTTGTGTTVRTTTVRTTTVRTTTGPTTTSTTTAEPARSERCTADPSEWQCIYSVSRADIRFNDKWVLITFGNGALLKIRVHANHFLGATFFTAVDWNDNSTGTPQVYKGLFGNRDGSTTNEIQTNFGVAYDTSASSISTVVRSWRVSQSASLFNYSVAMPYATMRNLWLAHSPMLGKTSDEAVNGAIASVTTVQTGSWCIFGASNTRLDQCAFDAGLFANIRAGRNTVENYNCYLNAKTSSQAFPVMPTNQTSGIVLKMTFNSAFQGVMAMTNPNGNAFSIATVNVPNGYSVTAGNQLGVSNVTRETLNDTSSFLLSAVDNVNGVFSLFMASVQLCKCQNGGSCVWDYGYTLYTEIPCRCPERSGMTGQYCEVDLDPCSLQPCGSGVCTRNDTFRNLYTCKACDPPYIGDGTRCYLEDACGNGKALCRGLATCRNTFPSYVCDCPAGYVSENGGCTDIDECFAGTGSCPGNSTCVNIEGSYKCTCPTGFLLDPTGQCRDINECTLTAEGPCAQINDSVCVNSAGSYSCQCKFGYVASSDKKSCLPLNTCNLPTQSCEGGCSSGNGTYTCTCRSGFTLSGTSTCVPTQTCSAAQTLACGNSVQAQCYIGSDGQPGCTCRGRFEYSTSTKECVSISQCTRGTHLCDLSISTCQDVANGYTCKCNSGYVSGADGISCLDVNECNTNNGGCNTATSQCVNTPGSFYCACNSGYSASQGSDGKITCSDVNECQIKTHDCSLMATCANTVGSYNCTCRAGYTGNGRICTDINECSAATSPCQNNADCVNTDGSYYCTCKAGYYADGTECKQIEWCTFSSTICPAGATCTASGTSYTCLCPSGYTYDGFNCVGATSCKNTTCSDPISQICVVNPTNGSESCQCRTGFSGTTTCTNVNECTAVNAAGKTFGSFVCPSASGALCIDTTGSYRCGCSDGYTLAGPGTCVDTNECLDATNCPLGSVCTNLPPPAKFSCACPTGFTVGKISGKCEPVDMCEAGLDACADEKSGGVCISGNGTYTCTCATGYTGDGFSCYDVNECAAAKSPCPQGCTNSIGSYSCFCYPGYAVDGLGVCQDVNECQLMKHNCDQLCVNVPGTFQCACQDGFTLEADGKTCKPATSCPANNGCQQLCAVVNGVSTCFCKDQTYYKLRTDGKTCEAIDICPTKPCTGEKAVCVPLAGGFNCSCIDGYKQSADGLQCVDRDGGWSQWSSWTQCTKTCGGGTQTRNRTCNNPTPIGRGLSCSGDDMQSQTCNTDQCGFTENEKKYAVTSVWTLSDTRVNFATALAQQSYSDQLKGMLATTVNKKCRSTPSACCGTSSDSAYNQTALADADFTSASTISLGNFFQSGNKFEYSMAVAAPKNNPVCAAAPAQARKKREFFNFNETSQMALPQSVLKTAVSDSEFQNSVISWAQTQFGITISISTTSAGVPVDGSGSNGGGSNGGGGGGGGSGVTSSQISGGGSSSSSGTPGWLIPVAVVGAVVVVAIIIIVVVIVIKKKQKVSDGGETAEKGGKKPEPIKKTSDPVKKIEPEKKKDDPKKPVETVKKPAEPAKKPAEPPKKAEPAKKPVPPGKNEDVEVVDEIELKKTSTTNKKK